MIDRMIKQWVCILFSMVWAGAMSIVNMSTANSSEISKRVPAEWELQEAIWLQWPGQYEKSYEKAFAEITKVISSYEKLHILHHSQRIKEQASTAIVNAGGDPKHSNIFWHKVANDSAWMRDNGPVYVIQEGEVRIQNWQFDAWGGAFGNDISYANDNKVPDKVGEISGLSVEHVGVVHERGNLEFNGVDSVILNWSTIGDDQRNPGYTREQAETDMKAHFGVSKVVLIEGVVEGDFTKGHVDGIARFINPNTVVVPVCMENSQCISSENDASIYENAARIIEDAGFNVIRHPIEGYVHYGQNKFDANYMNWLVGNGFVITVGFGDAALDQAAKSRIEGYFPGRDVYVIEMLESWAAGGGVHCHTNDQPALQVAF